MTDQVMVIECQSCQSRFRLARSLFKESRAIRVRCRKCGGYIVVENPDLSFPAPEPVPLRPVERVVAEDAPPAAPPAAPPPEREGEPESAAQPPELPSPVPEGPTMEETTRAMAELLREIDENAPPPPAPEIPPEPPTEPPTEPPSELPPELAGPDAGGRKTGYQGPVRVTPYPEPTDGSEALASVLEDLFKPGATASSAGSAPHAEQGDVSGAGSPSAPREPRKEAAKAAPRPPSARPPYANPLFLLVVVLWLLLLVGAALLFGTDYFDRWIAGWKTPAGESAESGKRAGLPAYEIRDVHWFSDNSFDGGAMFAVTGSVTLRGRDVENGIRISATILGPDNQAISEKTVFAGNFLDNTTLRHTKPDVVDLFLSRGVEEGGKREIHEGETLPFMAVFFDPPEKVHSVAVKPVYTVK